jgi:hypothetical protein
MELISSKLVELLTQKHKGKPKTIKEGGEIFPLLLCRCNGVYIYVVGKRNARVIFINLYHFNSFVKSFFSKLFSLF